MHQTSSEYRPNLSAPEDAGWREEAYARAAAQRNTVRYSWEHEDTAPGAPPAPESKWRSVLLRSGRAAFFLILAFAIGHSYGRHQIAGEMAATKTDMIVRVK